MNNKRGQLHLKLYITMIVSVVIAIFITSTILYVNFQSIILKNEYNAKLEKMENEAARITKLSNMALNSVYQIFNDIAVKKLLTYDNMDAIEESAAFIQLRHYLSTVPDVDSIYVYNVNNNRIYSVNNEADLVRPWSADYDKNDENFYDKSAINLINNCTNYMPYVPIPRYYQVNDNYVKCVYTYMMYNTFNANDHSDIVMLNLDSEYLFQGDHDKLHDTSLIVDQTDQVIYSNSDDFKVAEPLQYTWDSDDKMEKEKSGYFITEINGTKSVVIFTGPDKHHWRYISIIEYNVLLEQVNKMQAISILITLFLAVTGIIIAHIFSKRLSVPIRALSRNVKNLESENRQLERIAKYRKAAQLLKNGGIDSKENRKEGREFLNLIGMDYNEDDKLTIVCIQVDDYKSLLETIGSKAVQAYKFAASNILSELLGDKSKTYHVDMENDKCLVFINVEEIATKEYFETQIRQMQEYIRDYFNLSISVIVGDVENGPDYLYITYKKMEEALSRSIFLGEGYLIFISDLEIKSDYHYEYPEQQEKHLMESLMLGKASEAKRIYKDIIAETYQYPIIIYNMVISRLIFAIDNVVNVLKKNGLESSFSGYFVLTNLMQENDTIKTRNEKFYELFNRIQKELERRRSDKLEHVIDKINQLLETGFEDSSFSLDYLADSIGMSTAYMCRVYKQYTGNTIIDILAGIRMHKARELLKETQLSVGEIAQKVGYSNSTYFYRVFKKENGVTPNEFRKK